MLEQGQVLLHPFVLGELACGRLNPRKEILEDLAGLPKPEIASDDEVLKFIEAHRLMETGLGYIDAHILASTLLTGAMIWTLDSALKRAANKLGICFKEIG